MKPNIQRLTLFNQMEEPNNQQRGTDKQKHDPIYDRKNKIKTHL